MKLKSLGMAALLMGLSAPALADHGSRWNEIDGEAVLGGGLGGAAGAALGSMFGGRDTAMLGSAIGAAAGVYVLGDRDQPYYDHEPQRVNHHHYYQGRKYQGDNGWHRGHYKRARHHYKHWDD
ncbi:MAG: hypothetical protein ACREV9_01090 [Burkholderiales bacterium]